MSCVLVGAHYPSDVLGGLALGCAVADVVTFWARHANQLLRSPAQRSRLGLPSLGLAALP